ncbi:MAG: hypothetical protein FJ038_03480 [Chloroflexi bacterium]|nr:hypothetical protein [Chloroflexota bacterium]
MARRKATITLDREKVARAGALIGGGTISAVIDLALDRVIRAEELRRDIAAYARQPLDDHELAVADLRVEFDLGDDDVDYDAIYGDGG